jgi:hypothetical protein
MATNSGAYDHYRSGQGLGSLTSSYFTTTGRQQSKLESQRIRDTSLDKIAVGLSESAQPLEHCFDDKSSIDSQKEKREILRDSRLQEEDALLKKFRKDEEIKREAEMKKESEFQRRNDELKQGVI